MNTKSVSVGLRAIDLTKEQLIVDFKDVVSDAEALIKATANQGDKALAIVRGQAEQSIAAAKKILAEADANLLVRTKAAVKATDVYAHENPWQAAGVAVGAGLLIGFLLGRR